MDGGNFANRVSNIAGNIGTASEIGAIAAGATGVGAAFTPGLAGLATVMNTTSAVADMFGDGLSSSKMSDWADDGDSSLYDDLKTAVLAVGRLAGIENKQEAKRAAVDAYWKLVDAEGVKHLSSDEYYSGLSPNKLMESIGVDPGPRGDDDPTPRTQQLISEGVMSPPAGPGLSKGRGLSVQQAVKASGNLLTASQVRRAFEMGLLKPDQLHDDAYVSKLEYMLEEGSAKPRRYAKYATVKQPKHRPKLNYYHGTTYAKK